MSHLTELAMKISEATGMEGKELQIATFIVAALYADVFGRKDIGDYFMARAKALDKQAH